MTTPEHPSDAESYFVRSESWAEDIRKRQHRTERRAWLLVFILGGVAALEAIALVALEPLKTVVPYTLLVDRQTGNVERLAPGEVQQLGADSALTHAYLVQYVTARESFDALILRANYRKVALMTAEPLRHGYIAAMQAGNPASPLAALPPGTTVAIGIKSVTDLDASHALVRYSSVRQDANGISVPQGDFVALVTFRYNNVPMTDEQRFINPLGFTVTGYVISRESLPSFAVPGPNNFATTAAAGGATSGKPSHQQASPAAPGKAGRQVQP